MANQTFLGVEVLFPNLTRGNLMNTRFARAHPEMTEQEILDYFARMQDDFNQRLSESEED